MLKLRISRAAAAGEWRWTGTKWVSGDSWIEPFRHPSLETAESGGGGSRVFTVRERIPGPAMESVSGAPWPKEYSMVHIDASRACVRISAGMSGTAPIFACERDGVLRASWDLTDLPLTGAELNEREIARLLTLRLRYTAETIFAGVWRVTERASIETSFTGPARISYPPPAPHSEPRSLSLGADVIGAYEQILADVIAGSAYEPGEAMVELSGGLDSANVALALAGRPGGQLVRPGAMILEGLRGIQQVRRRKLLIAACGFTAPDLTVDATGAPPLHPAGARRKGWPVSPYDEPYHEAMSRLHLAASAAGVRTVFTGIGGDEMVALRAVERGEQPVGTDRPFLPWITPAMREAARQADTGIAPASQVNEMTLIAAGCAAPVILGVGSWPVHPFADPRLITFGEWLPEQWRRDKRLHRERLFRRGLSGDVAYPELPEVFTGIMDQGLREHGARIGLRLADEGGNLIDGGCIGPRELRDACRRIIAGASLPRDREVFDVIALELSIRSLTGEGSARVTACVQDASGSGR